MFKISTRPAAKRLGGELPGRRCERRRFDGRLAPLAALFAALAACAPAPDTFRYHLLSPVRTLDPAGLFGAQDMGILDRVFDGLVRLDRVTGLPVPEIAHEWSISPDGLTYEFSLREDVYFHHGRQVTAWDVEYSWRRVLDPQSESPNRWMLESVAESEVLGPHRLRVRLHGPEPTFLLRLTNPVASVVPQEEVERLGTSFARRPVGSGPYVFREWVDDLRVVLEAFPDHFEVDPQVRHLIYDVVPNESDAVQRFHQGALDLVIRLPSEDLADLAEETTESIRVFPGLAWAGFCVRCDRPPFDDVRVRRAFALAVDREGLIDLLGSLQYRAAAHLVSNSVMTREDDELFRLDAGYRPHEAADLLAAAGYPDGEGFPPLHYVTATSERDAIIAQFLRDSLARLGIELEVRTLKVAALYEGVAEGRFEIFRGGWIADFPDPEQFLRSQFRSDAGYNRFGYRNDDVDRMLDLSLSLNGEERIETLREIERRVVADAPCTVLVQKTEVVLLRRGWQNLPFGFVSEALEIERATWSRE